MKLLFILLFSIYSYGIELSQNAKDGKELYTEANCQKCHGIDEKYDAKKNKVKDYFTLKKWVSSCMTYFGHSWFPNEQKNVLIYLNEIKYNVKLDK